MLQDTRKRLKIVITLLVLVGLCGAGYLIFQAISQSGKAAVTIHVVPADATVSVDNRVIHDSIVYLAPGNHTASASKDGFSTKSTVLVTDTSAPNQMIVIGLSAESDVAKRWVSENRQLYLDLEGFAGEQSASSGIALHNKYPILDKLPFKNYLYSISYDFENNGSLYLVISAGSGYIHNAVNEIRNMGYDPVDFKILYNRADIVSHE